MKKEFRTICKRCDKVLMDGSGRIESAIFDSSLPRIKKNTKYTTYAWCEDCYKIADKK